MRRRAIFSTTGLIRSKLACASGCAASSRRCSRPSWKRCLPVPVMAGSRRRASDETTGVAGHRHGSRTRTLTGTFGTTEITVTRARLDVDEDKTVEWRSKALRAYQRRTKAADALIASSYLAGTNTR
ncbi:hypothetical protein EN781_04930, partial [Mesorhizobium sp. M4A.F.Ca.ET.090.04.2.1]